MNGAVPWIRLQSALGAGAALSEIIEYFGSAKALFDAGETEWRMSPVLVPRQIEKLCESTEAQANEVLATCKMNGWQVVPYDDPHYPERLRSIFNPPAVLYVDGELPDIDNSIVIGIVGTRRASDYAVKAADVMSRGIAERGAIVASGGALGVDTAAHNGAMLAGGKTIAVLGCGLGTKYLMENKPLRDAVVKNGALITEFQPFTPASKYTFPIRNRIISGISLGVLVVEASVKSGSLITANYALEQGRDVFALPCSILDPAFAGTNKLIDDGAIVATKPLDLLYPYAEEYGVKIDEVKSVGKIMRETGDKSANVYGKARDISFDNLQAGRKKREARQKAAAELSGKTKAVFNALGEEYQSADEISRAAGLSIGEALTALTALEIAGLAASAGGKRYRLA
ncbi:MAG: DNA-processing protein DprA [Eubacterium sp.]|jgi:DNA protecting protein dprA|nr:DNA-processing protein DprA [Eubacterium sp.]